MLKKFSSLSYPFSDWEPIQWGIAGCALIMLSYIAVEIFKPSDVAWQESNNRCNVWVGGWGWSLAGRSLLETQDLHLKAHPPSIADCKQALVLAAPLGESKQAVSHLLLGKAYFYDENYPPAIHYLGLARTYYQSLGLNTHLADANSDFAELDTFYVAAKSGKQLPPLIQK